MSHQAGSNPRPSDDWSNALTTKPASAAAESRENLPGKIFAIYLTTILLYTVASPDPDPDPKGGFPVMAETTRNHIFSKEISQVIIAAMVLAPNFY